MYSLVVWGITIYSCHCIFGFSCYLHMKIHF
jgi:hypothetical protein